MDKLELMKNCKRVELQHQELVNNMLNTIKDINILTKNFIDGIDKNKKLYNGNFYSIAHELQQKSILFLKYYKSDAVINNVLEKSYESLDAASLEEKLYNSESFTVLKVASIIDNIDNCNAARAIIAASKDIDSHNNMIHFDLIINDNITEIAEWIAENIEILPIEIRELLK